MVSTGCAPQGYLERSTVAAVSVTCLVGEHERQMEATGELLLRSKCLLTCTDLTQRKLVPGLAGNHVLSLNPLDTCPSAQACLAAVLVKIP
jgi:hypothetical protein